jgi:hypothetical protein
VLVNIKQVKQVTYSMLLLLSIALVNLLLQLFNTAVAISAGNASDITITSGGGAVAGTGYVIYRTKVGAASAAAADFFPIFKVSNADVTAGFNGGAGGVVRDRGYFLPDTEEAFITEMSDEILSLKQLAPLSKLDLAVISMSRRFISFMFCTPILYTPKKMVRYINVSRTYTPN